MNVSLFCSRSVKIHHVVHWFVNRLAILMLNLSHDRWVHLLTVHCFRQMKFYCGQIDQIPTKAYLVEFLIFRDCFGRSITHQESVLWTCSMLYQTWPFQNCHRKCTGHIILIICIHKLHIVWRKKKKTHMQSASAWLWFLLFLIKCTSCAGKHSHTRLLSFW